MSTVTTIRALETEDHQEATQLWEASVRATHHFLANEDINAMRPEVAALFPRIPILFGLFDATGTLLGICGMQEQNVDLLFVQPTAFRRGIGRQLMRHAIVKWHAKTVDVNEDNKEATAFYRRLGFDVKSRSETDGAGRPFPILHLRL